MTENNPEKDAFKTEVDAIKAVWLKKSKPESKSIFDEQNAVRGNTAEALDKKLRGLATDKKGITARLKPDAAQEIFKVQDKVAGKKNVTRTTVLTILAVLLAVSIGYPTKLAYEGKLEVKQLSKNYKLLEVTLEAINRRNYALYRKIFPQVEELKDERIDSALKGIEENLDLATKMTADADELWSKKEYDQAMELYDRATKINPLNNRSAYLSREAELAKDDQAHFKQFYVVRAGDTMENVAKRAKVSELRIRNANGPKYSIIYQGRLVKGMRLTLPININRPAVKPAAKTDRK
ncbi:MAG: LysM domain-containing protein [Elusimicrobiota bacterium]